MKPKLRHIFIFLHQRLNFFKVSGNRSGASLIHLRWVFHLRIRLAVEKILGPKVLYFGVCCSTFGVFFEILNWASMDRPKGHPARIHSIFYAQPARHIGYFPALCIYILLPADVGWPRRTIKPTLLLLSYRACFIYVFILQTNIISKIHECKFYTYVIIL